MTRPAPLHKDYLDGVRGAAALCVLLSHLWIVVGGLEARDDLVGRLTNWTLYSHFAVDIFIVLSGFCLTLPVIRDGGLRGGSWGFYRRRAWRILPPFYAALALSAGLLLLRQTLEREPVQMNFSALLANALLVQDLLPRTNIFDGPLWSVAVECRIYLLFPLLVWLLRRWGRGGVLLFSALAGGAGTIFLLRSHPEMVLACPWYLGLFALGMCAGSLSAERSRRGNRQRCGLVCVVSLAGAMALVQAHPIVGQNLKDFGTHLPVIDTVAGVGTAAGLLLWSWSPGHAGLLTRPPLTTIGTFAYSLYLIHLPCLLLLSVLLTAFVPAARPLPHFYALALTLPLVFALAWLFSMTVERPFQRRKHQKQKLSSKQAQRGSRL